MSEFQRLDKSSSDNWSAAPSIIRMSSVCADVDQVEIAELTLRMSRVHHKFSVDTSNTDRPDRSRKRNIRNTKCGGGSVDAQDIRVIFSVRTQEDADHLRVVEVAFRERADATDGPSSGK